MLEAAVLDGVAFDPFSFHQDGLPAPEATRAYPPLRKGLLPAFSVIGEKG